MGGGKVGKGDDSKKSYKTVTHNYARTAREFTYITHTREPKREQQKTNMLGHDRCESKLSVTTLNKCHIRVDGSSGKGAN